MINIPNYIEKTLHLRKDTYTQGGIVNEQIILISFFEMFGQIYQNDYRYLKALPKGFHPLSLTLKQGLPLFGLSLSM